MTPYDFLIIVLILASGAIGFFRGGAREIITLCAIVAAVIVDGLLSGFTEPFARKFIHPPLVGDAVAIVLVFVVVYMAVHWLGVWVGRRMRQNENLSGFDRIVGLGFGVVRGLVAVGIIHLFMVATTPAGRLPPWFNNAKLYSVSAQAAKAIQLILPRAAKAADAVAPRVEQSIRAGAADHPVSDQDPGGKSAPAYDRRQRDSMDALVEKTR
jgi:membrane protein required for colicin V production